MPTPIKWKDTFQVNTGDAALGIQSDARIIGLANGRILVAWTESATGIIGSGAGMNIIGQYLDVEGNRFGSPFQINTASTADDERDFDIAATSDGFVIVYVDGDIGTERTSIIWERRQFSGAVDTLRVADETSADYDFRSPQVAVNLLTNQSMVTYTRSELGDGDVLGVVVSAAGSPSAEFDAAENDQYFSGGGDVAILANGNYVAVFKDTPDGGGVSEAGWRIMTSTGAEVATFTVHDPAIEIRVATLVNGNWVMAYWQGSIIGGDIRFQIFTPTGTSASNTIVVASGDDSHREPDIVALPDGGFVVLWENTTTDTLLARRFTSTGASDGTVYEVATSVTGRPDIAVSGDGRILVAWTDEASTEVFASIWDPRSATVNAADYQANDRNFVETLYVTGGVGATIINGDDVAGAVLIGQEGNDHITGGANNQTLIGNGGDDTLIGGGSDPNVGIGGDILQGGLGNDSYVVSSSLDYIDELANAGEDIVYATVSYALSPIINGASVEYLTTISLIATTAINLTGNGLAQTIRGNNGANVLHGEGGNDILLGFGGNDSLHGDGGLDWMEGGIGDDIYFVDNAGDVIVEAAGQGFDTIYASASYSLTAGSEAELLSAADPASTVGMDLTGNEFGNFIYANAGSNTLIGGGGADVLRGLGGNDSYRVEEAADQVLEAVGGGFDSVYTLVSYTLANNREIEALLALDPNATTALVLTGNEFDNFIFGNAGSNTLIGGAGSDTLLGGAGNDFYRVEDSGDKISESAGGGVDSVYAVGNYTLIAGAAVELLSAIDPGNAVAMNLTGNEFDNFIIGNNGSNTLIGGAGSDTLIGNGGNDFYRVEDSGDKITETAGGGTDSAYAVGSYTLQAGAEVELLSAIDPSNTVSMNLIGNEFANRLIGNNGANLLNGAGGSDILTGFGGADVFVFLDALGAGNIDLINDFVTVDDTIWLDHAVFTTLGTGALSAAAFATGAAATTAAHRIIYNNASGALFYDADGNGAGGAVQFATLVGSPALAFSDFQVI